jgi:hypothetical protein
LLESADVALVGVLNVGKGVEGIHGIGDLVIDWSDDGQPDC